MHRIAPRWLALLAPVPILLSLAGCVVGCRTQTTGEATDGQKKERPAATKNEGIPASPKNGGNPADGQAREASPHKRKAVEKADGQAKVPPPHQGKAAAKAAYHFPLEIKLEAPEVPEAIRRPSPPIPKEAGQSRPKK